MHAIFLLLWEHYYIHFVQLDLVSLKIVSKVIWLLDERGLLEGKLIKGCLFYQQIQK